MNLKTYNVTESAFLVELGPEHVVVDNSNERVIVLNDSAAWVWTRLGTDTDVPAWAVTDVERFIEELSGHGMLETGSLRQSPVAEEGSLTDIPRILSIAPLEVAANTSEGDPW